MKRFSIAHTLLPALMLAGIATLASPLASADEPAHWYGRAGGPVGVEQTLAHVRSARPLDPAYQPEVAQYGRAGGAVGADAIRVIASQSTKFPVLAGTDTPNWYGRAGYPVGADALPGRAPRDTRVAARSDQ